MRPKYSDSYCSISTSSSLHFLNISSSCSFNPAACHLHTCNRSTVALQFFGIVTQTFLNFCLFSFQEFEKWIGHISSFGGWPKSFQLIFMKCHHGFISCFNCLIFGFVVCLRFWKVFFLIDFFGLSSGLGWKSASYLTSFLLIEFRNLLVINFSVFL
jgi:hypothetical protein